jgi:hypothetical protein
LRNQAIQRLYEKDEIQAALSVSQPNDPAEREADQVAEQVMHMSGAEQETDFQEAVEVRRKTTSRGSTVEGEAKDQIESIKSGGKPLSPSTLSFFEPRFGRDFSDIRVHTGQQADEVARAVDAEAFTRGTDVVFRSGKYDPSSNQGKKLLAHELTHVVQQQGDQSGPRSQTESVQRQGGGGGDKKDKDKGVYGVERIDAGNLPDVYAEAVKNRAKQLSDRKEKKFKEKMAQKIEEVKGSWDIIRIISYLINIGRVGALAGPLLGMGAATVTWLFGTLGMVALVPMFIVLFMAANSGLKGYQQEAKSMASSYGVVDAIKKQADGPPGQPPNLSERAQEMWKKGYREGVEIGNRFVSKATNEQKLACAAVYQANDNQTQKVLNDIWSEFRSQLPHGPSKYLAPDTINWPEPKKAFRTPDLGRDRSEVHGKHDAGGWMSDAVEWIADVTGPDIPSE